MYVVFKLVKFTLIKHIKMTDLVCHNKSEPIEPYEICARTCYNLTSVVNQHNYVGIEYLCDSCYFTYCPQHIQLHISLDKIFKDCYLCISCAITTHT